MNKDNHFIYIRHFPDPKSILKRKEKTKSEIFRDAIFVLDTNSLLAPYSTGNENIEKIRKVYEKLISSNRLFIPQHVVREFAKNRSIRISELYTNIDQLLSSIPTVKSFEYPILGEIDAYKQLKESINNITREIKHYKKHLNSLKSGIIDWNWSDPVTSMYQQTFTDEILIKSSLTEEELIKEYTRRIEDDIPPGNKDKMKEKNAIGDYVIWQSILELGKEKRKDIIFISNDEKNDWLVKGNKQPISTRFELVDEYFRFTGGFNFISITLNSFLEKQGLEIDIVDFFNSSDDRSDLIETKKVSTINTLRQIESFINDYLELRIIHGDDVVSIDEELHTKINIFNDIFREEYFSTKEWSYLADYLIHFSNLLSQIKSLNIEIIYQEHRMKRDTRTEVIQMVSLCKEFLTKYDAFKLII
ncbi:hypothetical protein SAMN05421741_13010 [Paenimyroides ummariense]|uniref:PIN like domain-containing protein n=1 Tax=Paenimyroides ummariense TaxID=913024 RepID=A0A1I5FNQ4_9FLAO|nr:PIN domain-containing protein [Paenimyroides ummariense]SFO25372.1 hypothetical protein SAMN05421741_13010 [Paenimyroides ummariense]